MVENIKHSVKSIGECMLVSISEKNLTYADKDGQGHTIDADNVTIAQGHTHNHELVVALAKEGYKVFTVGDCSGDDMIFGAIYDGHKVGRML